MSATLLIVDDDPATIRVMNSVLKGMGDLFFATDGESAMRTAREKLPDIVLLDAEMPGMDAYEVCAALKRDPVTAGASIIFVAGIGSIGD